MCTNRPLILGLIVGSNQRDDMNMNFSIPDEQIRSGIIGNINSKDEISYYKVSLDVEIEVGDDNDTCMLSIDLQKKDEGSFDHGLWVNLTLSEAIALRNALNTYIEMVKHKNRQ